MVLVLMQKLAGESKMLGWLFNIYVCYIMEMSTKFEYMWNISGPKNHSVSEGGPTLEEKKVEFTNNYVPGDRQERLANCKLS